MGVTVTETAVCDCCGVSITYSDPSNYQWVLGQLLCTQHDCASQITAHMLSTTGFTTTKAAHIALIVLGVIPAHP